MIKFILKGLLRDRQRSLFPIIIVAFGVMLVSGMFSYMQGVITDMIDVNAKVDTGHVKVMTAEYAEIADQVPNDLGIFNLSKLMSSLKSEYPMEWVARIKFGGLLDIPDENGETRSQSPVFGLGIDLLGKDSTEIKRLGLKKSIVKGHLPTNPGEIIISEKLAEELEVKIGESATLISSTSIGSMAVYNFKLVGTVRFGVGTLDRNLIMTDISDIQYVLDMDDMAGEVMGYFSNGLYNDKRAKEIQSHFNELLNLKTKISGNIKPGLVMLLLSQQNGLGDYLDMVGTWVSLMLMIFILTMAIILWNTGLMSGIRRYGELGLRLAVGESKGEIYRSLLVESILVGIVGSIVGTMMGLSLAFYLQEVGIDTTEMMKDSKFIMSTIIRARITTTSYYIGFIPGILAILFGTMIAGLGIYKRQTASLFKELEV